MKKKCKTCGELKPLNEFKKNVTMGHYHNHCLPCFQKRQNEIYQEKKREKKKMNDMFGFFIFGEK